MKTSQLQVHTYDADFVLFMEEVSRVCTPAEAEVTSLFLELSRHKNKDGDFFELTFFVGENLGSRILASKVYESFGIIFEEV